MTCNRPASWPLKQPKRSTTHWLKIRSNMCIVNKKNSKHAEDHWGRRFVGDIVRTVSPEICIILTRQLETKLLHRSTFHLHIYRSFKWPHCYRVFFLNHKLAGGLIWLTNCCLDTVETRDTIWGFLSGRKRKPRTQKCMNLMRALRLSGSPRKKKRKNFVERLLFLCRMNPSY